MIPLVVVTFLLAAGCTSNPERAEGGGTASSSAAAPAKDSKDLRAGWPLIVAFGDSLSEGLGADPGKSYPDYLQNMLDSQGYRYRVANLGISGDTTTGGLGRIESVIQLKPAVVILELGGNDGLRGVPIGSTRSNLEEIIQRLQKSGTRIVLAGMSLPPNYGPEYIHQFESMYKELARKHRLTLIPFLFEELAPRLKKGEKLLQGDGIHPTADGNRIVAETVLRYLKPVLEHSRAAKSG